MEKLTFVTDDNENVELYIIEETRANGVNYLLVTDSSDEEDTEFDAISRIFAELMDDDIELI